MTAPAARPAFVVSPWLNRVLLFIAFVLFLLFTFKEAGVSGLPSWLLGGGLTSFVLAFIFP